MIFLNPRLSLIRNQIKNTEELLLGEDAVGRERRRSRLVLELE